MVFVHLVSLLIHPVQILLVRRVMSTLVNLVLIINWNSIIMAMPSSGFELGSPSPKVAMLPTELTLQDNQTCLLCIRFLQRCCVPDFCNFLKIFDLNDTIVLNGLVLRWKVLKRNDTCCFKPQYIFVFLYFKPSLHGLLQLWQPFKMNVKH